MLPGIHAVGSGEPLRGMLPGIHAVGSSEPVARECYQGFMRLVLVNRCEGMLPGIHAVGSGEVAKDRWMIRYSLIR
jgi:hypothetical protein